MNRLQKHTMSNLNIIALFDMHLLIFFVFLYVCCFLHFTVFVPIMFIIHYSFAVSLADF